MIIKRLVLHNYRRFAHVELECPENIIGIIGRNGAGKTTLVEAIGWALYGNVISRTGKADIRSQFAAENESCSVELLFEYGGDEYRIVRQLKGKNAIAEAAIYRAAASDPEAVQERGVNEYVEQLLRLDYRSFFASVFARQRELAALSAMSPEERRRSISRLINIDRIDKARERVLADRKSKNDYIAGMRSALVDPGVLEERIAAAAVATARSQAELAEQDAAVARAETALQEARSALERISRIRDAWQQHESKISRWHASQAENSAALQRCRDDLSAIAEAENSLRTLRGQLLVLPAARQEKERLDREELRKAQQHGLLQQRAQLEGQSGNRQARMAELQARLAGLAALAGQQAALLQSEMNLETQLIEAREAQQHWSNEASAAKKSGQEARDKKEQIEKLGPDGECPTCTQRLAGHYQSVLDQMDAKLGELRQSWQMASQQLAAVQKSVAGSETALRQLRKEKDEVLQRLTADREAAGVLAQLAAEEDAAVRQLLEIGKSLEALGAIAYDGELHARAKEELIELEALQRRADQMEERAGRREQVTAEAARIEKVVSDFEQLQQQERSAQAQLGYDEDHFIEAKSAVEAATGVLLSAKESQANVREALAASLSQEKSLRETAAEQKKKREEIAAAQEEIRYLDALDVHLKKFRVDLAGRIRPLIARHASQLLSLTTNGRYSRLELDEDYMISLYDGNQAYALGRFSGGEQDLANLCLRVAISQILAQRSGGAPINFIVLDEIFGSQDEERKSLILYALGQLSSQFRQIFMITHVDTIKDLLPVIFEISLADEQLSEVRVI